MRVQLLIGVVAALLATGAAYAQTAGPPSAATAPAAAPVGEAVAPRPAAGNVVQRSPLPRYRIPPRSFADCNREAMARRYRGAERRHYVARCQLGVRRLFRRRGTAAPAAAPVPARAP